MSSGFRSSLIMSSFQTGQRHNILIYDTMARQVSYDTTVAAMFENDLYKHI